MHLPFNPLLITAFQPSTYLITRGELEVRKMALRHSGVEQQMCRRICGTHEGKVCDAHERRCVICDCMCDMTETVFICDDCSFVGKDDARCIVCNKTPAVEKAFYCRACVLLEKDRDGCPRVLNQSRHQRMAQVRGATSS